jgi:hypothetical protein
VSIALALGQIEEAMGILEDPWPDAAATDILAAYEALVLARQYLAEATAAEAARVPVALYAPITAEEVERNS